MKIDQIIQQQLQSLGQSIIHLWQRQVPVKTGALRDSINVNVTKTQRGWTLNTSYLFYGVYQNLGTGLPYQNSNIRYGTAATNPFRLPPARPYQKGIGGIEPRYWLSITEKAILDQFRQTTRQRVGQEISSYLRTRLK